MSRTRRSLKISVKPQNVLSVLKNLGYNEDQEISIIISDLEDSEEIRNYLVSSQEELSDWEYMDSLDEKTPIPNLDSSLKVVKFLKGMFKDREEDIKTLPHEFGDFDSKNYEDNLVNRFIDGYYFSGLMRTVKSIWEDLMNLRTRNYESLKKTKTFMEYLSDLFDVELFKKYHKVQ